MEKIDKKHRWLLDLCGFYKGEEQNPFENKGDSLRRMFWEYDRSWVKRVISRGEDVSSIDCYRHFCLESLSTSEDIPVGIKAILISRIVHWTDSFPTDESFRNGMLADYLHLRKNPKEIRKGKRILNAWRLERMLWESGYRETQESETLTEEQQTHFSLVDAVDGPMGTANDCNSKLFSEWKAVRMIEYAHSHGLTLTMVQNAETLYLLDLYSAHPEYKEIRELLFRHLGIEPESSEAKRCQYVGRYHGKYVYNQMYDEDGYPIVGPMTCIFDEDTYEFLHETQFIVETKAARNP